MSKRNKLPTWAMWIIFILCGSLLFAAVANVDNIKDKIDEWREDDTEESETNKKDDTDPSDTSGTTEPVKYTLSGVWVFNDGQTFGLEQIEQSVNFACNGVNCNLIVVDSGIFYEPISTDTGNAAFDTDWTDEAYRTLDFGTDPQEVSEEFYEWFTSNAKIRTVYTVSGVWVFNDGQPYGLEQIEQNVNFVCDGINCNLIVVDSGLLFDPLSTQIDCYVYDSNWIDEAYRTVDFGTEPQEVSEEFYTWLTANAVKQ